MQSFAGTQRLVAVVVIGWLAAGPTPCASACPFCFGSQQLTLRERIETPDAAVLVEWQSGEAGNINDETPASTTFRVLKVWQGDVNTDEPLTIDRYQEGRAGDRFLLTGNKLDDAVRWDRAIPLTDEALAYLQQLPSSAAPLTKRLGNAIRHLESTDVTIANDAFDVVANAKYEDIAAAKGHLSADRVRDWVFDPATHVARLGVYGMLLGLAGDEQDIPPLRQKLFTPDPDRPIRIGIDGVMGGFLMLTGADGLAELEAAFLRQPDPTPDDLNAVTSALRFMWEYGDGLIAKDRLRQSMRLALHHDATMELAITDLARWQDWQVTPQLVELYHEKTTDDFVRRTIIRFLLVAAKSADDGLDDTQRAAIKQAADALAAIRAADPILFRRAERGLVTPN